VVLQEFYEFVGNASGIEDFDFFQVWIADTLFCEVSLTLSIASVQSVQ